MGTRIFYIKGQIVANKCKYLYDVLSRSKSGTRYCQFECKCGKEFSAKLSSVKSGAIISCGCRLFETKNATHGLSKTRIYKIWCGIKDRCFNEKCPVYPDYGGRGITMCEEWRNSFENFHKDMGDAPTTKHSIERIVNSESYSKENCIWATMEVQCNNRRSNVFLTFSNEKLTLQQWSKKLGFGQGLISQRLKRGWSISDALTQPLQPKGYILKKAQINTKPYAFSISHNQNIPDSSKCNPMPSNWMKKENSLIKF